MTVSDKIAKIIDIKCGGNHAMMAEAMGVNITYVSKLKNGVVGMGMQQLKRLMTAFPDINPRWLILDDDNEEMIDRTDLMEVRMKLYDNIKTMLDIEHLLPFMSKEELSAYSDSVKGIKPFSYSDEQLTRWKLSRQKLDKLAK